MTPHSIDRIAQILKETGNFQRSEQRKIGNNFTDKGLNQLVSRIDIESEQKLVDGLRKITPTAGFLTEENTETFKEEEEYWIIDPLDGTTNYLFGHAQYAISIALISGGATQYGGVYVPCTDELFTAHSQGAFLNGQPLRVSSRKTLAETLIATGFPYYTFGEIDQYLAVLKSLMQNTKGLRRMGSAAIDLCYTANGKFDGFFELNLSPWDVAAGAYIIQQAGGTVTAFDNSDNYLFGNSIVAGNPAIHEALRNELNQYHF